MSSATSSGFLPCFLSMRPSLPHIVVLPVPCRPQSINIVGGAGLHVRRATSPPIICVNSSLTIFMTCCEGVRLSSTSSPTQRSVTRLTKYFATRKFTSASSSAMRTSRIAAFTSASLSFPRPDSFLSAPCSFSVSPSNAILCFLLPQHLVRQRGGAGYIFGAERLLNFT